MKRIRYLIFTMLMITLLSKSMAAYADKSADNASSTATGWHKYLNKWRYTDENGVAQRNNWVLDNDKWYYLDEYGFMVTGWKNIRNKWYYFSEHGYMKTGWVKYNNDWYYMNPESGRMTVGWLYWRNSWYLFNNSGKMTVGWQKWNDQWYYLGSDGMLYQNRLFYHKNTYYYAMNDGSIRFLPDQKAAELAWSFDCDLRKAMEYATNTAYYGREEFNASWGSQKLAEYGIEYRRGNCYVKAAVLREIAYAMGYDVHQIDGEVKVISGYAKHSWVEVVIDGKIYVCDPSYAYRTSIDLCFLYEYGKKGTYQHVNYKRMN